MPKPSRYVRRGKPRSLYLSGGPSLDNCVCVFLPICYYHSDVSTHRQDGAAAALGRTLQQRWSHLQAPGISPAHSAAGGSFLSTLTKIIQIMARTKAKKKTEFIAPLADFFSRGKGPDNKPMTDDQVRVYQCLRVFYTSDISDLFNDRPWRSSSAGPS